MSMNRRRFLKTGAALATAATAATAASSAAPAQSKGKRFLKAVKYNMIGEDLPVADKFRMLQDLGYDGVEMGFHDKVDPAEVAKARETTGLPIHGVVLGSVDGINNAIDRAVLYGATSVLLVAGRVNENMPYDRNYKATQKTIRASMDYAAKKEILLLVENVWNNFLLSPLEMARYIDELKNPWAGVYFDIGNVVRMGWPEHWIPVLGKRIHKLDIKEYSRDKQNNEGLWKGFDVKIGEGSVDWAAVRAALKAQDYHGWATAEVGGGDRDRLQEIAQRMDQVLND